MIKPAHLYTGLILAELFADALRKSERQPTLDEFNELAVDAAIFGHNASAAFDDVEAVFNDNCVD